jgi:hypothetical protein
LRNPIALACSFLFSVCLVAFDAAGADASPAMERGRELSSLFLQRKIEAVWMRMAPTMQRALGGQAKLEAFREQVSTEAGEEVELLDEKT